jgi:hypothetical protein
MGTGHVLDDHHDECAARDQLLDTGVVMHSFALDTAPAVMPREGHGPA